MGNRQSGSVAEPIGDLFRVGTVAGLTDRQLLGRFVSERDEAAFAALVARHGPMVLAVCRQLLGDPHDDADDAFQAVFLVLARRADSLRDPERLGPWLYKVARHSAQKANALRAERLRRQSREVALARAERARAEDQGRSPLESAEDFEILHQEIGRLPERYRMPVVLCYLEGLSHVEVARLLQKHVGTVGVLLSRARRILRDRLLRRGIAVPTAFLIVGWESGSASALPPALVAATACASVRFAARRAAASSIPSAAVAIAEGVLRGMLSAMFRTAAAVVLVVGGIVAIGAEVASSEVGNDAGDGRAGVMPRPTTNPPQGAEQLDARNDDGQSVTIRGQVVDPEGRPVAGAALNFADLRAYFTSGAKEPLPGAASGPDGHFTLEAPRAAFDLRDRGVGRCATRVFALAPGFGIAWADVPDEDSKVSVRLVADDVPIEGRILDLEGRPVAGAKVSVDFVWAPPEGDLSPWIEKIKARKAAPADQSLKPIPLRVLRARPKLGRTTGPDGRFRLDGIGRERIAELLISGPGFETSSLNVMTRQGPDLRAVKTWIYPNQTVTYHAARFTLASARCRPIVGTVRDKDTGAPLAGAVIQGMVYQEHSRLYAKGVEAVTDKQGQYRLLGLREAEEYLLSVEPAPGQPYPSASFRAKARTVGTTPLTHDMALKRGVLVRGRLTDKATGRPAIGTVSVRIAEDNPHPREFPGYDGGEIFASIGHDGRFQIATIPGPSLLTAYSIPNRYLGWTGIERIPNLERYGFPKQADGTLAMEGYHALVEINPTPGTATIRQDLQVDPGRAATVRIVDPEGRPLTGTAAKGLEELQINIQQPLNASAIVVRALNLAKPRRLCVFHPGRHLAGSLLLRGDEGMPLTLQLRPTGSITGRLVDPDGRSLDKASLVNLHFPGPQLDPDRGMLPGLEPIPIIGEDGRFRLEGLVPDLKYSAQALREGMKATPVFEDVVVGSGETRDLGDLLIPRPHMPEE